MHKSKRAKLLIVPPVAIVLQVDAAPQANAVKFSLA